MFSPGQRLDQGRQARLHPEQFRRAALVTQHKLVAVAADALAEAPSVRLTIVAGGTGAPTLANAVHWREALATEAAPPAFPGIDIDLAMIIYTSGSTGFPKGVMMTHRNIDAAADSITTYLENTPDDIILNVLPISFDYGLYQVLMAMRLGATLVLEKSFVFPQAVFETMRRERVTGFPIVPTMAALILQMRDLAPGSFPDLRYITNTAAALPPAHIARLQELFPRRPPLFDVRADRVQALHLSAAGRADAPPRLGRHRHSEHRGLRRRRGRRPACARRDRRARHPRPACDAGLLARRGRDGARAEARPAAVGEGAPHRRPLPHRRRGLPLFRRAQGRHHQVARREGEPEGGRERPLRASRRARGGGRRRSRSDARPGDQGGGRA